MDKQWIPTVAGVLEIVAAVCALIGAAAAAFACAIITAIPEIQQEPDFPFPLVTGLLTAMAGGILFFGLVSLIGGIASIRRRGWGWALAGSIAALFIMPPAGIFALVLVILGASEYTDRAPVPSEPPQPPAETGTI
jgi:hypothetical protein